VSVPPDLPGQDDELLARLAATLHRAEEPPGDVATLARLSFGLRDLDARLAELVADSAVDAPAAVRSATTAPRLLTFTSGETELELQVTAAGDGWDLVGQVVPPGPATVRVERAAGPGAVEADADELGRFAVALPAAEGPWRLVCRREGGAVVVTSWVLLG
jgi:hypothetical protein